MKKILIAAFGVAIIALTPALLTAGNHSVAPCATGECKKPLVKMNTWTTKEVCRRPFTEVKPGCCGEVIKVQLVEITYVTTDCFGNSEKWTKIYRCD